jgi:hypothetical protein
MPANFLNGDSIAMFVFDEKTCLAFVCLRETLGYKALKLSNIPTATNIKTGGFTREKVPEPHCEKKEACVYTT